MVAVYAAIHALCELNVIHYKTTGACAGMRSGACVMLLCDCVCVCVCVCMCVCMLNRS